MSWKSSSWKGGSTAQSSSSYIGEGGDHASYNYLYMTKMMECDATTAGLKERRYIGFAVCDDVAGEPIFGQTSTAS